MYHPLVKNLDMLGIHVHNSFPKYSKEIFLTAGRLQQEIFKKSTNPKRRYFDAQWCWALGHVGILYQLIRWFKLKEPETQLILETNEQVSNVFFLNALSQYITIYNKLPSDMVQEAETNAVYFACPDGEHHIHDFMHFVEPQVKDINLLTLSVTEKSKVEEIMSHLKIKRPFVAIQARNIDYDPKRNVSIEQARKALDYYRDRGFSVVSTGLDKHEINNQFPSVLDYWNPALASFLLSASCDQFIGSDSGAWTIPWAYRRPVELMNDELFAAWIYP